jgi:sugar/nucleoside kinase (ribokinase family)
MRNDTQAQGIEMPHFDDPIEIARRKNDLLCVGELLVDMIATDYGSLLDCGSFQRYAGGSPANIASNARRLGVEATIAAAVGSDGLGDFLIGDLARGGLASSLIQRKEESTSLVIVTKSRATPTPIFYRGADFRIASSPALESAMRDSAILHFSCWPLSMEPARDSVLSLIGIARGNGGLICLDPNYHPAIWKDRAEALTLLERVMPDIDIIKPSEDDADRLFGHNDPLQHIRRFLDMGARLVIMTLGKDGAIASDGSETREYRSLAKEIVDTTGAGDAFWSGLYAALVGGRTVDRSIRVGMAVCARKLRQVGAAIAGASLAEIEKEFGL